MMRKTDGKEIMRQFYIEYIAGEIETRRGKLQFARRRLANYNRLIVIFFQFARHWLAKYIWTPRLIELTHVFDAGRAESLKTG